MRAALSALMLSCAAPAVAQDISFIPPIDCDLDNTCFIQQYVDRDPSSGVTDHRCAGLSYDGHKGTDFALPSTAMMRDGVSVVAAAAGTVRGVRDGMADTGLTPESGQDVQGRECGNGVRIDHGDGWVTQYCHLKQGTVSVRQGQSVLAGDPLGDIGLSGRTEFPHVHFSVRKNGEVVDPFDPDGELTCNLIEEDTLWDSSPDYRAGGLIALGFSEAIPSYDAIQQGRAGANALPSAAPALVIWGYTFGTRKDDVLRLSIDGPDGTVITQDVTFDKAQAQSFRAVGKKRRAAPWPVGTYIGVADLIRDGVALETRKTTITID